LEIRRHALKLAEKYDSPPPEIWTAIRPLIHDPSEAVRLQLAFSLGEWTGPETVQAFVQMWGSQKLSSHIQTALISSLNSENLAPAINVVSDQPFKDQAVQERYRILLRQSVSMGNIAPVEFSLKNRLHSENDLARSILALSVISRYSTSSVKQLEKSEVADVRQQAQLIAENQSAPLWMRILGVSLVLQSTADYKADTQSIQRLLASDVPAAVRGEVVRLMGEQKDVASGALLLEGWPGYLPAMKSQVLEALASRPEWYGLLVEAMEQRTIQPGEISLTLRQRFLSQKESPAIKQLRQYFQPGDTSSITLDEIMKIQGNLQRGQQVFQKHCTECHQFQGEGFLVGPNLSSVTGRTPASLLEAIIDPNKAVEPKYFNYTLALVDGRILSGLIGSDFDHSLTLLKAKGETTQVLKNEIDELKSTGKSLMPEGFDKTINHQELADLILYLQQ
ncbi:MAG TPA: c-type cytochrome, partial [Planctomicrobium sp.]|nr:c-type cytochrome [Planctomicrobium sp.]